MEDINRSNARLYAVVLINRDKNYLFCILYGLP